MKSKKVRQQPKLYACLLLRPGNILLRKLMQTVLTLIVTQVDLMIFREIREKYSQAFTKMEEKSSESKLDN